MVFNALDILGLLFRWIGALTTVLDVVLSGRSADVNPLLNYLSLDPVFVRVYTVLYSWKS